MTVQRNVTTRVGIGELKAKLSHCLDRAAEGEAAFADGTGLEALDALHLGAAESAGSSKVLVSFDRRLAAAARSLGWTALGAE